MANLILTAEGWQERVRDKLGVNSAYLPDSAIEQPDIIDVAEAIVIKIIPNYATLTDSDRTFLEAATVCQCCVLICPSMPSRLPQREQGPHYAKEAPQKWNEVRDDLALERDANLGQIDSSIGVSRMHFGLTRSI
jgi:hypothetical protein